MAACTKPNKINEILRCVPEDDLQAFADILRSGKFEQTWKRMAAFINDQQGDQRAANMPDVFRFIAENEQLRRELAELKGNFRALSDRLRENESSKSADGSSRVMQAKINSLDEDVKELKTASQQQISAHRDLDKRVSDRFQEEKAANAQALAEQQQRLQKLVSALEQKFDGKLNDVLKRAAESAAQLDQRVGQLQKENAALEQRVNNQVTAQNAQNEEFYERFKTNIGNYAGLADGELLGQQQTEEIKQQLLELQQQLQALKPQAEDMQLRQQRNHAGSAQNLPNSIAQSPDADSESETSESQLQEIIEKLRVEEQKIKQQQVDIENDQEHLAESYAQKIEQMEQIPKGTQLYKQLYREALQLQQQMKLLGNMHDNYGEALRQIAETKATRKFTNIRDLFKNLVAFRNQDAKIQEAMRADMAALQQHSAASQSIVDQKQYDEQLNPDYYLRRNIKATAGQQNTPLQTTAGQIKQLRNIAPNAPIDFNKASEEFALFKKNIPELVKQINQFDIKANALLEDQGNVLRSTEEGDSIISQIELFMGENSLKRATAKFADKLPLDRLNDLIEKHGELVSFVAGQQAKLAKFQESVSAFVALHGSNNELENNGQVDEYPSKA